MKTFSPQIKGYKTPVSLLLVMFFIAISATALGQEGGGTDLPEENSPTDPGLPEGVSSLDWSPDGLQIAIGVEVPRCNQANNDYSVRILDVQTGQIVAQSQGFH